MSSKVHPEKHGRSSKKDPKEKDAKWHVAQETFVNPHHVPWKELSTIDKITKVLRGITKTLILLIILFVFISTFSLVSKSFNLIGGKGLGETIRTSKIIQNPISAAILGMVVTLVLQSSSTLISLLVGMVSGNIITVHQAIPIMMGSETGASILNALMSLTQSGDRAQFRRAFAAATMNDIFNFLSVATLLPLEILFKPIERLSALCVSPLHDVHTGKFKTLNALTDPILDRIIQVDEDALNEAQSKNASDPVQRTFVQRCIDLDTQELLQFCPYEHIFAYSTWSDVVIGIVLLLGCLASLALCMYGIVKIMNGLLAGRIASVVRKLMDKRIPYPFGWLTDYLVMLFAAVVVVIMESSSVFRSALTPLVGIGVVTLERFFPLVIGGNIGTTSTGILAAFSTDPAKLPVTLQLAFCQTFFNVFSALLFYPIPFIRRIPINLSMKFGDVTAKYRWFAIVYIIFVFFLMPAILLGISFLPFPVMLTVLGCIFCFFAALITVNKLQKKCPRVLPSVLKNWNFLPLWMRSLQPYDKWMVSTMTRIPIIGKRFKASVKGSDDTYSNASGGSVSSEKELPVQKLLRLSQQTQV